LKDNKNLFTAGYISRTMLKNSLISNQYNPNRTRLEEHGGLYPVYSTDVDASDDGYRRDLSLTNNEYYKKENYGTMDRL
jgi:hypothetical protein